MATATAAPARLNCSKLDNAPLHLRATTVIQQYRVDGLGLNKDTEAGVIRDEGHARGRPDVFRTYVTASTVG